MVRVLVILAFLLTLVGCRSKKSSTYINEEVIVEESVDSIYSSREVVDSIYLPTDSNLTIPLDTSNIRPFTYTLDNDIASVDVILDLDGNLNVNLSTKEVIRSHIKDSTIIKSSTSKEHSTTIEDTTTVTKYRSPMRFWIILLVVIVFIVYIWRNRLFRR